ncbi:MAG: hypothetical protein HYR71_07055 [Chloroflexi bacterium]|nr:hypothetical protein [Chloroflexota bacterium]
MDRAISIFFDVFTKNPLTVTLAVLGVICVGLAIIGRIPPMDIRGIRAVILGGFGFMLIGAAIGLAWLLTAPSPQPQPTPSDVVSPTTAPPPTMLLQSTAQPTVIVPPSTTPPQSATPIPTSRPITNAPQQSTISLKYDETDGVQLTQGQTQLVAIYLRKVQTGGSLEEAIQSIKQQSANARATVQEGNSISIQPLQAYLVWCPNADCVYPTNTSFPLNGFRQDYSKVAVIAVGESRMVQCPSNCWAVAVR